MGSARKFGNTIIIGAIVVVLTVVAVRISETKHQKDLSSDSGPSSNILDSKRSPVKAVSDKLTEMRDIPKKSFYPNAVDLRDYLSSSAARDPATKTLVQTNGAVVCDVINQVTEYPEREGWIHDCLAASDINELRAYDKGSTDARIQRYLIVTGDQYGPDIRRPWVLQSSDVDRTMLPAASSNLPILDFTGYGDQQ